MLEALLVLRISCLVEVVHVQLADERGKVVVFKVLRQDLVLEFVYVFNDKAFALVVPRHDVVCFGVGDDLVGLHQE